MGKNRRRYRHPSPARGRRVLGPPPPVPFWRFAPPAMAGRSAPPFAARRYAPPATARGSPPPSAARRFPPPPLPPARGSPPPAPVPLEPNVLTFPLRLRRIQGSNVSSWRRIFTRVCLAHFSRIRLELFRCNGKFIRIEHKDEKTLIVIDPDSYEAPSIPTVVENPEDVDSVVTSNQDFVLVLCQSEETEEVKNLILLAALSRGFKFVEY